ncbi:hypothetical protein UFOVP119_68 [uncultured Caudovirales phage]|uniref:Uncharacterized protein n=1 Tax=uncultured Caudovirales phage TaxID=2100421 RepID=A0A6J5L7K9_9CAUD|nr:hypothetical protein UFOVP119_68 [uncultured Caudovirales phage]
MIEPSEYVSFRDRIAKLNAEITAEILGVGIRKDSPDAGDVHVPTADGIGAKPKKKKSKLGQTLDEIRAGLEVAKRNDKHRPKGKGGGQFAPKDGGELPAIPIPAGKMPNWKDHLIDPASSNGPSHNAKVLALQSLAEKGDVKGILAMKYGTNTYGQRHVKLANAALGALGSPDQVVAGQARNSHPALGGTPKPTPGPAPTPTPAPTPAPTILKPEGGTITLKPSSIDTAQPAAHGWKPAKTLADAKAQLEAIGVKFKQGSFSKKHKDDEFLKILNEIGPEAMRLHATYPEIMRAVRLLQDKPKKGANGTYSLMSNAITVKHYQPKNAANADYAANWKNKYGMPWTVWHEEGILSTLRHEMGHAIDYQNGKYYRGELQKALSESGVKSSVSHWIRTNVSHYGGKNSAENMAEMFSLYSGAKYKPGTLPAPVEKVMDRMAKSIGKKHAATLAASTGTGEVAKAADDELIDIGPPPEGYELINDDEDCTADKLKFLSPSGEIVSYSDMVAAGLYGSDEG